MPLRSAQHTLEGLLHARDQRMEVNKANSAPKGETCMLGAWRGSGLPNGQLTQHVAGKEAVLVYTEVRRKYSLLGFVGWRIGKDI